MKLEVLVLLNETYNPRRSAVSYTHLDVYKRQKKRKNEEETDISQGKLTHIYKRKKIVC